MYDTIVYICKIKSDLFHKDAQCLDIYHQSAIKKLLYESVTEVT